MSGDLDQGGGDAGGGSVREELGAALESQSGAAAGAEREAGPAAAYAYPQHWAEDDRKLFESVSDFELRKKLADRFQGLEKGFQPKLTQHAAWERRYGSVDTQFKPLIEGLEGRGIKVSDWIGGVVQLEQQLMSQNPADRLAILKKLAETYEIDLAGLTAEAKPAAPVDPKLKAIEDRLGKTESALTADQQRRQQEQMAQVERQVSDWATEKDDKGQPKRPHFDAVEGDLAALVQIERAAGRQVGLAELDQLYERAVWGRPELRDSLLKAREAAADEKRRQETAEKAKQAQRAGASVPSTTAGGADQPEGVRELLRQSLRSASA